MKLPVNDCLDVTLTMSLGEGIDIETAQNAIVVCRSPKGAISNFGATIASGIINCSFPANVFNQIGNYHIWPRIIFSDIQAYTGSATIITVVNPWENIG
jgi:hypothetical protein